MSALESPVQAGLLVRKSLYPPELLLKAAYAFLNEAYIHFEETAEDWMVCMVPKDAGTDLPLLHRRFENELISQTVRRQVYAKTRTLRELLLARAMTTSMFDHADPLEKIKADELPDISDDELKDILTEWFSKNEQPDD